MTVDQAQQLRTEVLAVRDRLGIPEGHFAIDAMLDLPPVGVGGSERTIDQLSLRMPL